MTVEELEHSIAPLSSIGEKEIIRRIITPLFNPNGERWGVGDDCALLDTTPGMSILISTDRVPADLTAFRLGILDHCGLGSYLARLNLSDIAACGGRPRALLLNLGLRRDMRVCDLTSLLRGAKTVAELCGCRIVGGDLSDAAELSISATAVGEVDASRALSRSTAQPGDYVFISRPLGLTPATLLYHQSSAETQSAVEPELVEVLNAQFQLEPMFELAAALSSSGRCSSCMDNTDGIGQSLSELAECSGVAIIVNRHQLELPKIVVRLASLCGRDVLSLAFGSGADFSLIGSSSDPLREFGSRISIIGRVESGRGVFLSTGPRVPLVVEGWNYYI